MPQGCFLQRGISGFLVAPVPPLEVELVKFFLVLVWLLGRQCLTAWSFAVVASLGFGAVPYPLGHPFGICPAALP